jgi:hypothetical protein
MSQVRYGAGMIEGLPSDVDVPGKMLLAGYFVAMPSGSRSRVCPVRSG